MEHTLPLKICFSEQQTSFSLGEQCGLIIIMFFFSGFSAKNYGVK